MGKEGYASLRSWMAAPPVAELPPRMRMDVGTRPKVDVPGR